MKKAKILVPVVTVFDEQGNLDYEGNKKVIEYLIDAGVDGILALGSTGEFVSLSDTEKRDFINYYIETVNGRCPVYVGTGTMDIDETIELSNYSIEKGAAGVCVVVPYYFTVDDEIIYNYYDKLASNVNGNIFIYNYPARTANSVNSDVTVKLLEKHKNIVGYKDSSGNVPNTRKLILSTKEKFPEFEVYSGFDGDFLDNVVIGGAGVIGALSNIRPDIWTALVKAYNDRDFDQLIVHNEKIIKLMEVYNIKKNFIPLIKLALNINGLNISEYCKFPVIKATQEEREILENILKSI